MTRPEVLLHLVERGADCSTIFANHIGPGLHDLSRVRLAQH